MPSCSSGSQEKMRQFQAEMPFTERPWGLSSRSKQGGAPGAVRCAPCDRAGLELACDPEQVSSHPLGVLTSSSTGSSQGSFHLPIGEWIILRTVFIILLSLREKTVSPLPSPKWGGLKETWPLTLQLFPEVQVGESGEWVAQGTSRPSRRGLPWDQHPAVKAAEVRLR